ELGELPDDAVPIRPVDVEEHGRLAQVRQDGAGGPRGIVRGAGGAVAHVLSHRWRLAVEAGGAAPAGCPRHRRTLVRANLRGARAGVHRSGPDPAPSARIVEQSRGTGHPGRTDVTRSTACLPSTSTSTRTAGNRSAPGPWPATRPSCTWSPAPT